MDTTGSKQPDAHYIGDADGGVKLSHLVKPKSLVSDEHSAASERADGQAVSTSADVLISPERASFYEAGGAPGSDETPDDSAPPQKPGGEPPSRNA